MEKDQAERLMLAVEQMALAFSIMAHNLAGINETQRKEFEKRWPAPGERREAIVTRVLNEEDRIREVQGTGGGTLQDWLGLDEEEFIGVREREFIKAETRSQQPGGAAGGFAFAEEKAGDGKSSRSPEAAESEVGTVDGGAGDYTTV